MTHFQLFLLENLPLIKTQPEVSYEFHEDRIVIWINKPYFNNDKGFQDIYAALDDEFCEEPNGAVSYTIEINYKNIEIEGDFVILQVDDHNHDYDYEYESSRGFESSKDFFQQVKLCLI